MKLAPATSLRRRHARASDKGATRRWARSTDGTAATAQPTASEAAKEAIADTCRTEAPGQQPRRCRMIAGVRSRQVLSSKTGPGSRVPLPRHARHVRDTRAAEPTCEQERS